MYFLGTGRPNIVTYDLKKQNKGSIEGKYVGIGILLPWKFHYDYDIGEFFWRPDTKGKMFGSYVESDLYKNPKAFLTPGQLER